MINHKQFRPGNLVNVSGKPEEITGILQFGMYFHLMYYPFNLSKIEPIPITEELLLKTDKYKKWKWFGDENWGGYIDFVGSWKLMIRFWQDGFIFEIVTINKKRDYFITIKKLKLKIKYIHQLQNIYLDLTDEELEINSTK